MEALTFRVLYLTTARSVVSQFIEASDYGVWLWFSGLERSLLKSDYKFSLYNVDGAQNAQ